jgi:argininosuccinate lyase
MKNFIDIVSEAAASDLDTGLLQILREVAETEITIEQALADIHALFAGGARLPYSI